MRRGGANLIEVVKERGQILIHLRACGAGWWHANSFDPGNVIPATRIAARVAYWPLEEKSFSDLWKHANRSPNGRVSPIHQDLADILG